jgi:hypothetical protein
VRHRSEEASAFCQYIGSTALDTANLMTASVGFLHRTDPRILATIDAIEERLTDNRGLVYRYRGRGRHRRPRRQRGHLPCSAPSGWRRRSPWLIKSIEPAPYSSGLLERSRPAAEEVDPETEELPVTSRRPLVTSAWLVLPGRSRKPNGEPGPDRVLACRWQGLVQGYACSVSS